MMEAPSESQKHAANMVRGAWMLAEGRAEASVSHHLRASGMTRPDIEACWPEIMGMAERLIRERRKRIRAMAYAWLGLGLLMLVSMLGCWICYGILPLILLVGGIPLGYGIYLLRLRPTQEPTIDPPRWLGRRL